MCFHILDQGVPQEYENTLVTLSALVICFTILTKNVEINTLVLHR